MEVVQVLGVSDRRQPVGRHDLGLEAVGPDPGLEMVGDVQRDHLDASLRAGDGFPVGVPSLDLLLLRLRFVAEERVEQLVQRIRPVDGQVGQSGLVHDLHRRPVQHRLADGVGVDQRPEPAHGAATEAPVDGRAGEPDQYGVGQRLRKFRAQLPVLGAVGFVHHDDDVVGVIERVQFALGRSEHFAKLLDGGHHRPPGAGGQQPAQVSAAAGLLRRREPATLECLRYLPVQLLAVGYHHDGRVVQRRFAAQLGGQPQHGERLARALGVPHHAAPFLGTLAFGDALDRSVHRPVLLVSRELLDQLAAVEFVDDIVP